MPKKQTKKATEQTPVDTRWANRRVGKDTYFQITLTGSVPSQLTVIVDDAPDEETAIKHAEEFAKKNVGWFNCDPDETDVDDCEIEVEEFYSDQSGGGPDTMRFSVNEPIREITAGEELMKLEKKMKASKSRK